MMAMNLQVRTLHAPYVRSFTGFGRPWNHLEELIEDIDVREVALGSGYIVTGQAPRSRRRPSGKPGPSGLRDNGTERRPRRQRSLTRHDLAEPVTRRWPVFSPAAVQAGARAVFGFPL